MFIRLCVPCWLYVKSSKSEGIKKCLFNQACYSNQVNRLLGLPWNTEHAVCVPCWLYVKSSKSEGIKKCYIHSSCYSNQVNRLLGLPWNTEHAVVARTRSTVSAMNPGLLGLWPLVLYSCRNLLRARMPALKRMFLCMEAKPLLTCKYWHNRPARAKKTGLNSSHNAN